MEAAREKAAERPLGPGRCPFCHEGCTPEDDAVACRGCLARHHRACWDEGGRCAACGQVERLGPAAPPTLDLARARALLAAGGHGPAEVEAFLSGGRAGGRNARLLQAVRAGAPPLLTLLGVIHVLSIPWLAPDGRVVAGYALLLAVTVFPLLSSLAAGLSRRWAWALGTPLTLAAAGGWGLREAGPARTLEVLPYGFLGLGLGLAVGLLAAFLARRLGPSESAAPITGPAAKGE